MYALFEDAGKFLAGRILSDADTSLQIELASGKRAKVKSANVLMRFASPEPAALLDGAAVAAKDIDLDLAWQFAPDDEFGYADLANDYFGASSSTLQQAAALLALFGAPHYFRRLGKGRFRKAPEEIVKAALLGIERKKQVALQIEAWAVDLAEGRCPPSVREHLYRILFRPDKNSAEYKAVVEASRRTQRPPLALLTAAGAIDSPYQFHWKRFLFESFAKGVAFPPLDTPKVDEALPMAEGEAFSIDDSATTEIDDALSVRGLGSGRVVVGIHIAAPALAIAPGSPVDAVARERLSTVYIPGHKITMLPAAVVDAYTLQEGRVAPVVSLYASFDEATFALLGHETRIERITIAANLRHDVLEASINAASLAAGLGTEVAFGPELTFLDGLARTLKAGREAVRGKPENFNRPDYTFRIDVAEGAAIAGDEHVAIGTRARGSALDLIVAETMIFANSTWGGLLASCGVPGIYRSQASMAPGVKVRMGTRPAPHAGMGVAQYAWSSSPLRRYVDLVNQWQLLACVRHGNTAALVAPFKAKDVQLLAVIADFDTAYAAYNGFQASIERYWALQWLRQEGVDEVAATVMKDGLVRADTLPLVFRAVGAESLARGAAVRVRVGVIDLLTLDLAAQVVAGAAGTAPADDAAPADDDDDEAAGNAGPLDVAIDVAGDSAAEADTLAATPA